MDANTLISRNVGTDKQASGSLAKRHLSTPVRKSARPKASIIPGPTRIRSFECSPTQSSRVFQPLLAAQQHRRKKFGKTEALPSTVEDNSGTPKKSYVETEHRVNFDKQAISALHNPIVLPSHLGGSLITLPPHLGGTPAESEVMTPSSTRSLPSLESTEKHFPGVNETTASVAARASAPSMLEPPTLDQWITQNRLDKWKMHLRDLAEEVEDLKEMEEDDVEELIKEGAIPKLAARRLRKALSSVGADVKLTERK